MNSVYRERLRRPGEPPLLGGLGRLPPPRGLHAHGTEDARGTHPAHLLITPPRLQTQASLRDAAVQACAVTRALRLAPTTDGQLHTNIPRRRPAARGRCSPHRAPVAVTLAVTVAIAVAWVHARMQRRKAGGVSAVATPPSAKRTGRVGADFHVRGRGDNAAWIAATASRWDERNAGN